MNCQDMLELIPAYLDEEVSPSEKKLIQTHLAACQNCQQEIEAIGGLRKRMRQHLKARAATVTPSPQAWTNLKTSLPTKRPSRSIFENVSRSFSVPGWLSIGKLSPQMIAVILVVLIALFAVAPPVWARLEPIITNWFGFSTPDGENFSAIGGFTAFTPYHATYLPEGFRGGLLGSGTGPDLDTIEVGYDNDDQFIKILQSKGVAVSDLPAGEHVLVNTEAAVFIPSYATSQEEFREKQPAVSIVTNYDYGNTNLLAWFMGEIKIEIFSNLPLAEILKVAESLEHMQASESKFPHP